jgi:serine protease
MQSPSRRALVAGLLFGAALTPSLAFAQDRALPAAADFAQCLDGAAPATQNVPVGAMDHHADWDEVILDFDDSLSDSEIQAIARQSGLTVRLNSDAADAPNVYIARVAEGAVPYVTACLARRLPAGVLEAAEENFEYGLFGEELVVPEDAAGASDTAAVNDPLYQFQWHFKQVNAEAAWKVSSGKGVVVSVIDTGVAVADDASRNIKAVKDLSGTAMVPGYDFVDKKSFVFDGHGHGTHVAGTIAQTTNNKYGAAGLAYGAKIMPVRVLNSQGFGQVADIADAVRWSADNGAQVINMSLGGPLPSLVLKTAIDYAHKKGVTVVAAAGNGGRRSASYPAAYNHVIAVAATQYDKNTTFYSQWGDFVDIAAPGGNTRVDQNGDGRPDGVLQQTIKDGQLDKHDFLLYMGTSMASPHVAAAAAMVISQGVTHPDKVEKVLKATADASQKDRFSSPKEFQERYGAGLMQVDRAVKQSAGEQGAARYGLAALLALMVGFGVRRRDMLGIKTASTGALMGISVVTAGGLFFLPFLLGGDSTLVNLLARPLAEMNVLTSGFGAQQNPLLASALIPLAAFGLLGGMKRGRTLAAGLAIGMAAFCLAESVILTSDVLYIPGMDLLDRAWLVTQGLASLAIGYVGLKRY